MPEQLQARQRQLLDLTRSFVEEHLVPLSQRHDGDSEALRQAVVAASRATELLRLTHSPGHSAAMWERFA
ncbi:MAG: hypothetical protein JJU22_12630 [Gammaproteobacteria bacterium]|nr:hypothetical protein [Gammaproteobacteria bacterium]